ncbi:MAG: hypothetical protein ABJD68_02075 [Nakamurella sp.]
MNQPQHDAMPNGSWTVDRTFEAIISAWEPPAADTVNALKELADLGHRQGARRDIRRIASTLFCSSAVDPSLVTFAKQRTAQHWGMTEDQVDVQITARLLGKTARLMADRHIWAADAA